MRLHHAIGFDDAPFDHDQRGAVTVVGAAYTGHVLHSVVSGQVQRDGNDSTAELTRLLGGYGGEHLGLILLQGIALAGFNVIDVQQLHADTGLPVMVVARRQPNLPRIQAALLQHVQSGENKWRLVQQAGEMEPCGNVYVQRVGLSSSEAAAALQALTVTGNIPEPLRAAHLIAGGMVRGRSTRQRV